MLMNCSDIACLATARPELLAAHNPANAISETVAKPLQIRMWYILHARTVVFMRSDYLFLSFGW